MDFFSARSVGRWDGTFRTPHQFRPDLTSVRTALSYYHGLLPFQAGSGNHPICQHPLDLLGALPRLGENSEEIDGDLQLVHLGFWRRQRATCGGGKSAAMTSGVLERQRHGTNDIEAQEPVEKSQASPHVTPTKEGIPKDLEAALTLLQKNDDTSRFVGLALLKPVLEQELNTRNNSTKDDRPALVQRCWGVIPVNFIDRLLKARANEKRSKDEANNMVGLAVAVLHAFMTLLDSPETDENFMGRVPLLRSTLRSCPQETREQIMSIFHALVMTPQGSSAIFGLHGKDNGTSEKPESYLFVTMLLIDIRSTIPSLQEKLHASDYAATSERLSRAYDLISAFIGFLIQSLEDLFPDGSGPSAPLPIDLLLKLRTNISETLSLTIEHLRDRYDSSIAGAAGLHPSARTPNSASSSTPLPITWDTASSLFDDSLTLSQLRALSLWLRDEENDALRNEAAGIMDVLLALYQHNGEQDFRSPVLVALEGITQTPNGIEAFLGNEGWSPFANDLHIILAQPQHHALGLDIVRILLTVVESDIAGPAKEEWMAIVNLAQEYLTTSTPAKALELPIAISQLAVELLVRAPPGLRKKYHLPAQRLLTAARAQLGKGDLGGEDRDGLEEVVEGLVSLNL